MDALIRLALRKGKRHEEKNYGVYVVLSHGI